MKFRVVVCLHFLSFFFEMQSALSFLTLKGDSFGVSSFGVVRSLGRASGVSLSRRPPGGAFPFDGVFAFAPEPGVVGGFVRVIYLSLTKNKFLLENTTGDSHLRLCPASSSPSLANFRSSAAPPSGWRLRAQFVRPNPLGRRSRPRPSSAEKGRAEEEKGKF